MNVNLLGGGRYRSWQEFAEEVATAVLKERANMIRETQRKRGYLRGEIYGKAHAHADPVTWADATDVLIDLAVANDWLSFVDLARNYHVSDETMRKLWQETRTTFEQ